MAKVYTLYSNGTQNSGWFVTQSFTPNNIQSIVADGKEAATSIPSPFAQMALVKAAFDFLAQPGCDIHYDANTKENRAHHKLVSDALDVAQLFFEFSRYKRNLKIVSWDSATNIQNLLNSGNPSHKSFAETLDVYWKSDAKAYNFTDGGRIYMLLTSTNAVIGSTSPATLFMAAPDVRTAVSGMGKLTCGTDVLFDDNYASLDKRDPNFILYFYTLAAQPNFATYFPEVRAYLNKVTPMLAQQIQVAVANIVAANLNDYDPCCVLGNIQNPCEVLGIRLGVKKPNQSQIGNISDFVISSDYKVDGLSPLVLPQKTFNLPWVYTTVGSTWDSTWHVDPAQDRSVLPNDGTEYPWLTADDFLENVLIKLPYDVDSSSYITCGLSSYLLPLKPLFFQCFDADKASAYLQTSVLAAGGIEVTLSVPVKRGSITFKKVYSQTSIVELDMHLAIVPFLKTTVCPLDYTIGVQDTRPQRVGNIQIVGYCNNSSINFAQTVNRKAGNNNRIKSDYYKTDKQCVEAIRVSFSDGNGFIVPKYPNCGTGNNDISFAIDFGTTNTHIEYRKQGTVAKPFEMSQSHAIWRSLMDPQYSSDSIHRNFDKWEFERELFPYEIGITSEHHFPMRTALAYNKTVDFKTKIYAFTHANYYMSYEKRTDPDQSYLATQLKWNNGDERKRVLAEKYIDVLLYMVLYKTLLEGCRPDHTKIIWFYPVSMTEYEYSMFKEHWEEAYKRIFGQTNINNLISIPESVAPYYYNRVGNPGISLSIDIGGGSSDIAYFVNGSDEPEFISSVRFAGNDLYGDAFAGSRYSTNSDVNGFVKRFADKAASYLNEDNEKRSILDNILTNTKSSSDFSSYLFSLGNDGKLAINYTDWLKGDKRMKFPILLFFAALFYYAAKMVVGNNKKVPSNIFLSGTAAKSVSIIGKSAVEKLARDIFSQVCPSTERVKNLVLVDFPKEITCKGALQADLLSGINGCKMQFWIGFDKQNNGIFDKKDKTDTPKYSDMLSDVSKTCIKASIGNFYSALDMCISKVSLQDEFDIEDVAYEEFKKMRNENLNNNIEIGLEAANRTGDNYVEDSMFFYPISAMINKLAYTISKSYDNETNNN